MIPMCGRLQGIKGGYEIPYTLPTVFAGVCKQKLKGNIVFGKEGW